MFESVDKGFWVCVGVQALSRDSPLGWLEQPVVGRPEAVLLWSAKPSIHRSGKFATSLSGAANRGGENSSQGECATGSSHQCLRLASFLKLTEGLLPPAAEAGPRLADGDGALVWGAESGDLRDKIRSPYRSYEGSMTHF